MGGGDLNLKKSWHPSTLKNIERVWKAEQKHEAEKQKIEQLQRELAEERAKEEMRQYAEDQGVLKKKNERLDWMYQGPAGLVDKEQYLLGRKIDKTFELLQQQEDGKQPESTGQLGAIFDQGPVNTTVDLANKIREDPLFAIRKREVEQKKRLLDNPIKMKQLQQMLKQSIAKKDKKRKKSKKKHKKKSKQSSSSSEADSDCDKVVHRKNYKTPSSSQSRNNWQNGNYSSDSDTEKRKVQYGLIGGSHKQSSYNTYSESKERKISERHQKTLSARDRNDTYKRHLHSPPSEWRKRKESDLHRIRSYSPIVQKRPQHRHTGQKSAAETYNKERRSPERQNPSFKRKLDEKEMERRRQEMIDNAKWREEQRQRNVQRYQEEEEREQQLEKGKTADFIRPMLSKAAKDGSVQGRIKQKIYNIQRDKASMNENFAKR